MSHHNRWVIPIFLILLSSVVTASPKIGDKAPPIHVATWLTKKPPATPGEKAASDKVFLIDFWATWCPPCLKSIPHLSMLQKKHEKDGLIIIAVSNEEPKTIRHFIEKKMKMPYYVGSDDGMKTTTAWANDIQTIPHAFLVDKTGVVVFSGNPLSEADALDRRIEQVLAGTFDLAAARKDATIEQRYKKLISNLQPAYATRDAGKIFKLLDEMIALKPLELQPYLIKRKCLAEFDRPEQIPTLNSKLQDALKDSPAALRRLVQIELDADLASRNPDLMWRCALRANALSDGRDPETVALLARVQYELGMVAAAITSQTQAVGLAPDAVMTEYKKILAYYRSVKKLQEEQLTRSNAKIDPP